MNKVNEASPSTAETNEGGKKFLTFQLDQEEYGIDILKVREIIGMLPITRVPRTPDFMMGVTNLRGKVIPIMDLRQKFGMDSVEHTEETCIIVVRAHGFEMGVVVDRVSEVLTISPSQIDPAPAFGGEVSTEYLLGIGKHEKRVILLLFIDRIVTSKDVLDLNLSDVLPSEEDA